jgi:hypothetical protein
MRFWNTGPLVAAVFGGAVAVLACQPVFANDWRYSDRVSADSFGNLIVYSAAGYKRIIVGQGHLAKELSEFTSAGEPRVVTIDEYENGYSVRRCKPALLKGRSYMYGLPDGVIPTPGCRP